MSLISFSKYSVYGNILIFIDEVSEGSCQVVAISVLLTTSLPWVVQTVQALEDAKVREQVKLLVGGAVMDEAKALEIGADGYAPDAARAVDVCKKLLGIS